MATKLHERIDVKQAIANSVTSTAVVGIAVDTTGFARARFVFSLGGTAGIGALSASQLKIWKATGSGATFTSIASAELAAISSGVISGGTVAVIDVPTDPSNAWLKVSGSLTSSNLHHNAVVELYGAINRPPTSSANQIVTI